MLCVLAVCFFNDPATTEIYTYVHTLSLHDALPIYRRQPARARAAVGSDLVETGRTGDCVSYVIRAAKPGDLQSIYEMAKLTGGGFTNLPPDKKALRGKLERAEASFAHAKDYPADALYLLVLVDRATGAVRGPGQP